MDHPKPFLTKPNSVQCDAHCIVLSTADSLISSSFLIKAPSYHLLKRKVVTKLERFKCL